LLPHLTTIPIKAGLLSSEFLGNFLQLSYLKKKSFSKIKKVFFNSITCALLVQHLLKGQTCTPPHHGLSSITKRGSDSTAGLRRGYGVVTSKQGIKNTLALPIDKMLHIYLLCPHSEHRSLNVKPVLIR
jgi:hypothetical protein